MRRRISNIAENSQWTRTWPHNLSGNAHCISFVAGNEIHVAIVTGPFGGIDRVAHGIFGSEVAPGLR
jgi:hypothetical protein